MTALAMADDLASLLLLKKLKQANRLRRDDPAPDLVEMNSFVEFRFGGGNRRFCRLLHPSVCDASFDLSIDSRLGAGIIGLRAGQELMWPDDEGFLRELRVIAVKNGERGQWLGSPWDGDDLPPSAA
jgi:regulator of nucleoside diphosphate kinase